MLIYTCKGREILKTYADEIIKYITNKKIKLLHYPTLDSTNIKLKELANSGALEGTVVIADTQTAGRGRFCRKFYSPENGIYMSILLRPESVGFDATLITTAAAVAVAKAAENLSGKDTEIKWVNDVLINGKKICGILTEGAINPESRKPDYVIVGIGINAFLPDKGFDDEIKDIAGAVFDERNPENKAKLITETINFFMDYYTHLTDKAYLSQYRKKSAVIGKKITVFKSDSILEATAIDIDDDCRLLVEYPDNSREYLSSGEISIKI